MPHAINCQWKGDVLGIWQTFSFENRDLWKFPWHSVQLGTFKVCCSFKLKADKVIYLTQVCPSWCQPPPSRKLFNNSVFSCYVEDVFFPLLSVLTLPDGYFPRVSILPTPKTCNGKSLIISTIHLHCIASPKMDSLMTSIWKIPSSHLGP